MPTPRRRRHGTSHFSGHKTLAREWRAVVFLAFSTLDADRSIGDCVQASFSNLAFALNAFAVLALADSLHGRVDQAKRIAIDFDQAQRELLLEIVAPQLGHVNRHGVAIASLDTGLP